MIRKLAVLTLCILSFCLVFPQAALTAEAGGKTFTFSTTVSRPLCYDKLVYMALKTLDCDMNVAVSASMQVGYSMTDSGERDAVISGVPDMEDAYPNLRKVPVAIERVDVVVLTRQGEERAISSYEDLGGLSVGIPAQRVYLRASMPADAEIFEKDSIKIVTDGLLNGEYDAAVITVSESDPFVLPVGLSLIGKIDEMNTYLYLHKKNESMIPALTEALEQLYSSGTAQKVANGEPVLSNKRTVLHVISTNLEIAREDAFRNKLTDYFIDDDSLEWYTLALNSVRFDREPSRLESLASLLRQDCVSKDIAAIIVSGEEALQFIKEYYHLYFHNIPVLFYGIGEEYKELIYQYEDYFSGIVENISALETVEAAIKFFPDTKNVFVVNCDSIKGSRYRAAIEKQLLPLAGSLNITYNDNVDRDELFARIKGLPEDSVILLGSYFHDADGQYYSQMEMKRALERECDIPVFSFYSTEPAYNAIGGLCIDYEKHGTELAGMLNRLLAGEVLMPVVTDTASWNKWVFDDLQMREYGVKYSLLPPGSVVVNKRLTIWDTDRLFVVTLIIATLITAFILAGVYFLFTKNRRQERDLLVARELLEKETAVAQVKEQLESIIQTAPVSFLMAVGGRIVDINQAMREDTGLSAGDDVNGIYVEQEDRGRLISALREKHVIKNYVTRYRNANGQIRRCLASFALIEQGTDEAFVLWSVDIEEDERIKDQIRQARHSLQMLLDVLPVPVRIVDVKSETIIYVNNAFLQLFKYRHADDICGKQLAEIVPASQKDGGAAENKIKQAVSTDEPIELEVTYKIADGSKIEALLTYRFIEYNDKPCSLGIIRDMEKERREIELRRAAMAAESASRAKSAFIANMSHEIRTPMNSIVGFAELALTNRIPPDTRDYLIKIRESSNILLRIINDILDISKIESGKIELETIPFDIHEVFKACQTVISPRATEKGIMLYCYAEPSVGKTLLGDPTKLRQALLNLLSNAVKFTNTGTVKLLAAIEGKTEKSVTMRFEVKDSGIGMSPDQVKVIFEPFMQADESTTRKYGGTGLGLSITKSIVELMGGELRLESALGVGSRFSFTLTFDTVGSDDVTVGIASSEDFEKPAFKGEVLICEDNVMNRQVICEHLARVGLKTIIAINGREGVELVKARMEEGSAPFDLIFMDIHMPVMDGLEATAKLNEMGNKTPIIALTANVMASDQKTYKEFGMTDYVAKPFRTQELWACLMRYLSPLGVERVPEKVVAKEELDQMDRLRICFAEDQKLKAEEINAAIIAGDTELAVRLAHNLKGVAALVGKPALQKAAAAVEQSLTEDEMVSEKELDVLKAELDAVLAEFSSLARPHSPEKELSREEAAALLVKLDRLLASGAAECLEYTDRLRALPDAQALAEHIEQYDFPKARKALTVLLRELEK